METYAILLSSVAAITFSYIVSLLTARDSTVSDPITPGDGTHSCVHCAQFVIPWPAGPIDGDGFNFRLRITYYAVHRAALNGCQFCQWIRQDLFGLDLTSLRHLFRAIVDDDGRLANFAGLRTRLARLRYVIAAFGPYPYVLHFGHYQAADDEHEAPGGVFCLPLYFIWSRDERDVSADEGNIAANFLSERPINRDVGSAQSFGRASAWLAECRDGKGVHQDCYPVATFQSLNVSNTHQSASPSGSGKTHTLNVGQASSYEPHKIRPARLVDVSRALSEGIVELYQTGPTEEVNWCTLSYCWGGDQIAKLTKNRLNQYQQAINLQQLPATIKDAIHVTQRLGFRYIWIDALCIIQDDDMDKLAELVKMPAIYGLSELTISASASKASTTGFLERRETPQGVGEPLKLRIETSHLSRGIIVLSHREPPFTSYEEPTNRRAWCFQERMLSVRILDYGTRQLRWVCRGCNYMDGGANPVASPGFDGTGGRGIVRLATHCDSPPNDWAAIIQAYTVRRLTFSDDKLIALAAIAEIYGAQYNLQYLAGLWRETLPENLCWSNPSTLTEPRPSSYRAPTWSWAAIEGHISFGLNKGGSLALGAVDCTVEPRFKAQPYGAVKSGHLKLTGRALPATWEHSFSKENTSGLYRLDDTVISLKNGQQTYTFYDSRFKLEADEARGKTSFLGFFHPDAVTVPDTAEVMITESLWCMQARTRGGERRGTVCLLFADDSSGRWWERRGILEIGDARNRYDRPVDVDFFQNAPTITADVY